MQGLADGVRYHSGLEVGRGVDHEDGQMDYAGYGEEANQQDYGAIQGWDDGMSSNSGFEVGAQVDYGDGQMDCTSYDKEVGDRREAMLDNTFARDSNVVLGDLVQAEHEIEQGTQEGESKHREQGHEAERCHQGGGRLANLWRA